MKAIVLTCDKYLFLADHMINSYQRHWSTNPFTFRVPYGEKYPQFLKEKYEDKVELIQTDSEKILYPIQTASGTRKTSLIKQTVLSLIEDIADEEWVYWCLDDRYLIKIKQVEVMNLYHWIKDIKDVTISGMSFNRVLGSKDEDLQVNNTITNPSRQLFIERKNYNRIFRHQFLRAKVLRTLFKSFPDRPFIAKEMDHFKKQITIPEEQKLYSSEKNMVVFGESTLNGKLTLNCALSLQKGGFEIPQNFKISIIRNTDGELPIHFLGKEIVLPKYLEKNKHKFDWQYIKFKLQNYLTVEDGSPYK